MLCVLLSAQIDPPPLALLRERKSLSKAAGSAPFKPSSGIRGIAEWPLTLQCRKGLQSNKSQFYTPHSLTRTWQEIINLSKEWKQAKRKLDARVDECIFLNACITIFYAKMNMSSVFISFTTDTCLTECWIEKRGPWMSLCYTGRDIKRRKLWQAGIYKKNTIKNVMNKLTAKKVLKWIAKKLNKDINNKTINWCISKWQLQNRLWTHGYRFLDCSILNNKCKQSLEESVWVQNNKVLSSYNIKERLAAVCMRLHVSAVSNIISPPHSTPPARPGNICGSLMESSETHIWWLRWLFETWASVECLIYETNSTPDSSLHYSRAGPTLLH